MVPTMNIMKVTRVTSMRIDRHEEHGYDDERTNMMNRTNIKYDDDNKLDEHNEHDEQNEHTYIYMVNTVNTENISKMANLTK
jgi:hypothetical protein